jgi:hypothetical protein
VLIPPQEWKAETVGRANATKDDVAEWAVRQGFLPRPVVELPDPTLQDAFDSYCLARAARSLNQRAIGAA